MEEIWKDVPGYEGFYQASNLGRLRSVDREVTCMRGEGHITRYKGKILKVRLDKDGYEKAIFSKGGKHKTPFVHRVIAATFIANPENYPVINHINEIKNDNRVDNLEWCSVRYNNVYNDRAKKANVKNYKPVRATHLKTGEHLEFHSMSIAVEYGFSPTNISQCCAGEKKSHCGYKWEYINKEKSIC